MVDCRVAMLALCGLFAAVACADPPPGAPADRATPPRERTEGRIEGRTEGREQRWDEAREQRPGPRSHLEQWRAERIAGLRAEHAVVAAQAIAIESLAGIAPLDDVAWASVHESLAILRVRLDLARLGIDHLERATVENWRERDDAVRRLMINLALARAASWNALHDGLRISTS